VDETFAVTEEGGKINGIHEEFEKKRRKKIGNAQASEVVRSNTIGIPRSRKRSPEMTLVERQRKEKHQRSEWPDIGGQKREKKEKSRHTRAVRKRGTRSVG